MGPPRGSLADVVAKAHQNLALTTGPNLQRGVAMGLGKDDAYFRDLVADMQARRDRPVTGLANLGMAVPPTRGGYFVTTDFRPIGFRGDDGAFCRCITEAAKMTAVPVAAFYHASGTPRHYARFAPSKRVEVLDKAVVRLRRHFCDR